MRTMRSAAAHLGFRDARERATARRGKAPTGVATMSAVTIAASLRCSRASESSPCLLQRIVEGPKRQGNPL